MRSEWTRRPSLSSSPPRSTSSWSTWSSSSSSLSSGAPDYVEWDRTFAIHPYASLTQPRECVAVRSARGCLLRLEDGRELVDGISSWWSVVHGYRHPALDAAVAQQLGAMAHVMFGGLTHRPGAQLCKTLCELSERELGMRAPKAFLADSGSVAVEVAMKMAVQFQHASGRARRSRFLTIRNGYHGDTFGAMSVCDPDGMHAVFGGVLQQQLFAPAPQDASRAAAERCAAGVADLLAQHADHVAAVIIEPVMQGAGGLAFYHPHLLRRLRGLCDGTGALLILDEIATGFGRTGTLFAAQQTGRSFACWHWQLPGVDAQGQGQGQPQQQEQEHEEAKERDESAPVTPDILCVGKALTGGYMTMGAAVVSRDVCEGVSSRGGVFMHGPTFMANPLACAAANASLGLLLANDSEWQQRAARVNGWLREGLAPAARIPGVRGVRALGAVGVCELDEPLLDPLAVQAAVLKRGVWLRPFGRIVYAMPPFNCPSLGEPEVRRIAEAICDAAAVQAATQARSASPSYV